jgi:hypothetical protein
VQNNASQCSIKLNIKQILELSKEIKDGAPAATHAHSVLNTAFWFVVTVSKTSAECTKMFLLASQFHQFLS